MTSLSRQLRGKKRTASEAGLGSAVDLSPPELKREESKIEWEGGVELQIDEPVDVAPCYSNILFICNTPLTTSVKEMLTEFEGIRSYDRDLFTNRDCQDLFQNFNVSHVWINLKDKHARGWLGKHLMENTTYTCVVGYTGSKNQKFISDLEKTDKIKTVCKVSELNSLKSLSMDDLIGQLMTGVKIHAPASRLAAICGLSRMLNPNSKTK